jgi:feruloyl esterase
MRGQVRSAVATYVKDHPSAGVYVTGHSLGAALAALAALDLTLQQQPLKAVYTFGQPRIGNQAFAHYLNQTLAAPLFRVVHHRDPIPHLPAQEWGFYHPPTEVGRWGHVVAP